ncbi:hypothetical protein HCA69_15530 [Listeria grandensis]|uniref:Uncharacterized protein n=1 Tax=Listeria grandensis TaxID=1494963 RepID=A0A7X1CR66_9LIST|nr:hypothetical protein [Listeria grandensis]MBC1937780.1 hypothetical protein [Listeria grandensis]
MAKLQKTVYLSEENDQFVSDAREQSKRTASDEVDHIVTKYRLLVQEREQQNYLLAISREVDMKLEVLLEVVNAFLLQLPEDVPVSNSTMLESPTITAAKQIISERVQDKKNKLRDPML